MTVRLAEIQTDYYSIVLELGHQSDTIGQFAKEAKKALGGLG